jgi:hypothetical protein
MILKLNFWSFFSLHITFYQRLDDRMQAKKAKNALERPISPRPQDRVGGDYPGPEGVVAGFVDSIAGIWEGVLTACPQNLQNWLSARYPPSISGNESSVQGIRPRFAGRLAVQRCNRPMPNT